MKSKNGGLLRVPALKGFHIFLDAYSSDYEGMPNVLIEALCLG